MAIKGRARGLFFFEKKMGSRLFFFQKKMGS